MTATEVHSPAWSPELAEALEALLSRESLRSRDLKTELEGLSAVHGEAVYSEWVYLLCRLRFAPAEATEHWRQILEHQTEMEGQLGRPLDPRMALIHYFLEIHPQLESPIVIEMNLFEEARETAYRDELTGLRNYRFFSENLEHEVRRSEQVNQPVSLVMVDLDDFKRFNDRYGHQEGNRALAAIAGILERAVRVIDGVSRFGGEEFGLVLPATPKIGAQKVGERVRQAIEAHQFTGEEGEPCGGLTASLGIATFPGDAKSPEELVRNADRALYVAKSKGKNLVEIYRGNRRSFPRRETRLDGSFRTLGEEHPLTTVDLSTGGLKFRTDRELPVGALLDVQMTVPGASEAIGMAVRVVACARTDAEVWEIAAQTLEIARHDLGMLSRYLGRLEPAARPDDEDPGAGAG